MIQLITRANSQGYLASFALKRLFFDQEVGITFSKEYSLSQPFDYDPEAEVIIILGVAYKENQRTKTEEYLGARANPFTDIVHIASFGDRIELPYVTSIVSETTSNVAMLYDYLQKATADNPIISNLLEQRRFNPFLGDYIQIEDDYHRYDFTEKRDMHPVDLHDFINLYGQYLTEAVGDSTVGEVGLDHKYTLEALKDRREQYIARIAPTADIRVVKDTLVIMLYAEDHVNEIAHWFMEQYYRHGFHKIVVLIGKQTKGSDLFQVRTKGVHAGELANYLNKGGGKEQVGTVFLGKARQPQFDTVITMLENRP